VSAQTFDWHIGWTLYRLGFTSIIALENYGWLLEFTPAFFGSQSFPVKAVLILKASLFRCWHVIWLECFLQLLWVAFSILHHVYVLTVA
jgi:hypothetical protein